jgi:hypothetical protein
MAGYINAWAPAYRALSLSGHRVLARINIEHAHHGGQENGELPVTFRDFSEYGVHWNAIAPAIREVQALGFIRVTQEGWSGNGEWCRPNKFALTHLPTKDSPKPTEDRKRIKTLEEAEMIAGAARKSVPKKQKASIGKRSGTSIGNRSASSIPPVSDFVSQSTTETVSLSISRAAARTPLPTLPSPPILPSEGAVPIVQGLVWTKPTLEETECTEELRKLYRCEEVGVAATDRFFSSRFVK